MLERLNLENFQTHERLDLDLNHPVTVLIGPSDAGKSSVLRALRWLCTGQAPKSPMPTWGSDNVKVMLTADGRAVERSKGKNGNSYALDSKRFDAVGKDNVPEEVAALLNVAEQNFARQHQSHFWLADTPGEVSRQLNSIVNLGLIDDSLAAAASELRDARHAEQTAKERLEQAQAKERELAWVEEANTDLQRIERIAERLNSKQRQSEELTTALETVRRASRIAQDGTKQLEARERALDGLQRILTQMNAKREQSEKIGRITCEVQSRTEQARAARETADRLERELAEKMKSCPICRRPMPSSP